VMTTETRTYRGATVEEVLPQIRRELGDDAMIIRQREGLVGGIAGFFSKKCVEVEAKGVPADRRGAPTRAIPARRAFDAYDAAPAELSADTAELRNPVLEAMIEGARPFAEELEAAARDLAPAQPAPEPGPEHDDPRFEPMEAQGAPEPAFAELEARLVELGLPEATAASVVREAERGMRPFDAEAAPQELVRRALARQVKIEHGWKTKRRTIALVGPAGAGKTLAAAKLCHAYSAGSRLAVRTLSLEPSTAAYRLGQLTDHLDIGLRIADTPQAAARAATRMQEESLIVVDTPPVGLRDAEAIASLSELLAQVKADEVHLVVPATMDARAARAFYDAVSPSIAVNRILITGVDDAPTLAPAVGLSFAVKKPISYLAKGRRATGGLRPADPAEVAELVLP
jgi:flagellar biosynthesis protein FlhF